MRKARIEEVIRFTDSLGSLRNRIGVIYGKPQSGKSQFARELSQASHLTYLDVTSDLLPNTSEPLGAYDYRDFLDYLLSRTMSAQQPGLIVDDIEPLLATFGRSGAQAFFHSLKQLEPRSPILVVTNLIDIVESVVIPANQLLQL